MRMYNTYKKKKSGQQQTIVGHMVGKPKHYNTYGLISAGISLVSSCKHLPYDIVGFQEDKIYVICELMMLNVVLESPTTPVGC